MQGSRRNSTTVLVVAIVFAILALVSFFISLTEITTGVLINADTNSVVASGASSNAANVAEARDVANRMFIIGLVRFIATIALTADAVGLFMQKAWAFRTTTALAALSILLELLLSLVTGNVSVLSVGFILICGVVLFFWLKTQQVKVALHQAA